MANLFVFVLLCLLFAVLAPHTGEAVAVSAHNTQQGNGETTLSPKHLTVLYCTS